MVTKNPLPKDVLPAPSPQCRKCEDFKPVEAFVLSTLSKSKHRGCCKACWSDYVKARRQAKEVERRITTTSLSLDVEALHAFAGQIVAAVKELSRSAPAATNLALALEKSHAVLEANLASVQAGRVANGLPPLPLPKALPPENEALPGDCGASKIKNGLSWVAETEFQTVKESGTQGFSEFVAEAGKRKVVEVVTEIQADLNPVPQRASLVRGELMAEPVPLQDLPDGATEDNYAQAQMIAEDEAERLAQALAEAAADAQNLAALEKELADASGSPQEAFPVVVEGTPQEILLGANKIVVDLDLTKDNF